MPDLHQTLRSTDLDYLQRIARAWHYELISQSFSAALAEIEARMVEEKRLAEVIAALPTEASQAWNILLEREGRETWAAFTRQFGELRPFGLAKRSRENPDLNPTSAVEMLWYRGLIGRAFLSLSHEPQEYAYIPDEFLILRNHSARPVARFDLRPAVIAEVQHTLPASDILLDDATEMLATLRMSRPLQEARLPQQSAYLAFLTSLMTQAELLTSESLPEPEKVKEFLSAERPAALLFLYKVWKHSEKLNDLRMVPGLLCEGPWENNPLLPRRLLLDILQSLQPNVWLNITSLLNQVKEQAPDFQRTAGDYDSWFIRDAKTGNHLRGFANWEKVEGALLRYILTGPLHWLGMLDLARAEKTSHPAAFRISTAGTYLLQEELSPTSFIENGNVTALSDGNLLIPRTVPRALRYQLERFCLPVNTEKALAKYCVNAASLHQATEQGLRPTQLITLLQQARVKNIPQSLNEALERWEKYGSELKTEPVLLLRLEKPELLPLLQKSPRVARCLAEVLNSKTVVIKPGSLEPLQQALAEIGLLAEVKLDGRP